MNTSRPLAFLFAATALTQMCGLRLSAAGSPYILIQKKQIFDQISSSGPVPDPQTPFSFDASAPVTGSFTPPGGTATPLTLSQGDNTFGYDATYATLSALNTAFPDGSYLLSVSGGSSFSLGLTGDLYPNTPQVTGGTWNSSGQLVVTSSQSNTLNFNTFTGYGTIGVLSHMQLQIQSPDGNTVGINQSYLTPSNPTSFSSYVIPSGTLSPGSFYQCQYGFDTVVAQNITAVPGDTALAGYSAEMAFILVTSGTPVNPPTISQQPSNQTAPLGSSVTFNLQFTGGNNTLVQWFKNGIANYTGQSGSSLTLNKIQASDAGSYFAILASGNGAYIQTNTVTLTIGSSSASAPSFQTQPVSQTISGGSTVAFHANASGSPAPSYQWHYNGGILSNGNGVSGATGATLVINGATGTNAGTYYCVVSNPSGSIQSNTATLSVISTANIGRLTNISCRAQVGTGANILFAGFFIGGAGTTGTESVLIRGSGPALIPLGVTGTLADPQLQLYSGSTPIATNNGWAGNAAIGSAASSVGAFPWPNASSHDSALLETLVGGYTAQISGQSGDTGDALAEVYDATPAGSYTPATPRLINISARVQVGTGANILFAGFVIGGSTSKTVLIRASGPALIPLGVTGTLPDPELQLYTGTTLLGVNVGWGGDSAIVNAAAAVGAFPWGNLSSSDSAILVTLPPGSYTAQVSGFSGDTGDALVEVYEVP
jgi:Immunoglobulin domain